jgi:hypothetical protein
MSFPKTAMTALGLCEVCNHRIETCGYFLKLQQLVVDKQPKTNPLLWLIGSILHNYVVLAARLQHFAHLDELNLVTLTIHTTSATPIPCSSQSLL